MSAKGLPSPSELEQSLGSGTGTRRFQRWWVIGGLALVAAAVSMLAYSRSSRKNQVQYESVPVTRGELRVTVRSTGTLQAVTSVAVGSEISGRVLKVLVDVNDEVRKGQILAEIDPEEFGSSLDQAKAQVVGAKAAISLAEATTRESARIMSRNQNLMKEGILSQADFDASLSTKERADASLSSAQENARIAKASLDMAASKFQKTTIRAPIDGVVLARLVEPGQTVTAGFQTPVLFKLAQDLRKMRLNVDIDEAEVSRVRGGQLAEFTEEGEKLSNGKHRVWTLKDGKPEPIEVKLGATDGRLTEVLAGSLQEGMQVLTDAKEPS